MTDDDAGWQDRLVGARMSTDAEFDDRIEASRFSRQEWGLIMTATEFDIEDGDEPRLYADTEHLEDIMPEVEKMAAQGPMGNQQDESGSGILGSITSALGFGGDDEADLTDQLEEAEQLTQQYAEELQSHLESRGTWDDTVAAYRDQQ
ncbi:MAG: DUF5799 family protein [Halobacteriales archaeon]|nr:DUF5799 family protein [Halobacteriales archaeon]